MNQINFNDQNFYDKKRGHGKWKIFSLGLILATVGYVFFNLGGLNNSVSMEKTSWWQKIGNLFASIQEMDKSKDALAELNRQFPLPPKESQLDILIMGTRGRDDPDGGLLSDSIMLLSFNPKTGKMALTSLPRDIYVEMPAVHKGKINELYVVGLSQKSPLDFTKKVFSRLTGVSIDNVIVFDFQSFQGIIDTLGGIDLNLKRPFEEKTQWGYTFSLPAGSNHLNGQKALYYVRSRYSTSDFDRSHRQQEVMLAVKDRALSLNLLKNPSRAIALLGHLKNDISTDLDIWDTKSIISLISSFDSSTLITKNISTDNFLDQTVQNEIYILQPKNSDWATFRNFFQTILNPPIP